MMMMMVVTLYKRLTLNLIGSDRKDDPSFIEANMRKLYCTAAGWAVCDMMDLPSLGLIASVMAPKKKGHESLFNIKYYFF